MRQKLEDFFRLGGYRKLFFDRAGMYVYFDNENGFVNVAVIYDADEAEIDAGSFADVLEKIHWRFLDAGAGDVHMLALILSENAAAASAISGDNPFAWVVDTGRHELIVDDEKTEDFYGIRSSIEVCINSPAVGSRFAERPLEYDAGGRLCYHSITQRPLVNHGLLILNLLGYVLCIMFAEGIYDWGDLRWSLVFQGQWYRLITHMFIHSDPGHLTGNMLLLLLVGDIAERALGHVKYAILFLFGGFTSAALSMAVSYMKGSMVGSVGASGAVFAVVGAILAILLLNRGRLETLTTKKILFLIAYTLYFGFTSTGVDNAAHVGGLAGGFVLGLIMYSVMIAIRKRRQG